MATKQIFLPDIGQVYLYKKRGNRSLRISLSHDGRVRVSMPYWAPYYVGEDFARSQRQWIQDHRRPDPNPLRQGQRIGKAHHLYFVSQDAQSKSTARIGDTEIKVHVPPGMTLEEASVQQAAQRAGVRALRQEAEALLPQRLATLSKQTGLTYKSVMVRQLKSRWGSCNSQKEITLSLFLMQLPWRLIDYVLIHELTHTKVMRHGKPFWQEIEQYLPNAKILKKEIASYHPILTPEAMTVA
ncbi:MAG TPA: SprT family zinc-dependent metalloprotease [Candidatus Saccharimonadales bacterium]|nr:SprT family zinc-dependent metalloprotease [Candidatus Saccharimonadales bacterium]